MLRWLKSLFGKQQQVVTAIKELADLPPAVVRLVGVIQSLSTLDNQLKKALSDGKFTKTEQANFSGRLHDLVTSAASVAAEVSQAVEAVRPLLPGSDGPVVAPTG